MKKLFLSLLILSTLFVFPSNIFAQGMMGRFFNNSTVDTTSTAKDEAAGKVVFDKLQSNQITCQQLSDDDFDVLGDYYMGQMAGNTASHAQMNARMSQMMGDNGEKQMHIALGKRLSGCNTGAAFPSQTTGLFSMMGFGSGVGGWGMMNSLNGWFGLGWLPMFLFWILIALGIFGIAKLITNKTNQQSPMDVLKSRYAKGKISRKEFEDLKKDLL